MSAAVKNIEFHRGGEFFLRAQMTDGRGGISTPVKAVFIAAWERIVSSESDPALVSFLKSWEASANGQITISDGWVSVYIPAEVTALIPSSTRGQGWFQLYVLCGSDPAVSSRLLEGRFTVLDDVTHD
jgi:hypothetical protein